jgi:outer membrane murein-binding lipoprotein Lpp
MKDRQGLIILAAILGVLLIAAGIWGVSQSRAKKQLASENTELSGTIEDLEELRADLIREVDSLQQEYAVLAEQNSGLQGSLLEAQDKIAQTEAALRNAKARSSSEINSLRAEIQQLLALRSDLESNIKMVQAENDSLRAVTGLLEADLSVARDENVALSNLNRTIQGEVDRLTLANFKATAFQVDLETRGEKQTARARRARNIRVSFDLTDVPPQYQGLRTLYLSISDEQGMPVRPSNAIMGQTIVNDQKMDFIAVQAKEVDITANQRLTFNYEVEDKLNAGYYRVTVYTDIGMLGSSSLRLQ